MSAPRRPSQVPGSVAEPALLEQLVQHELHLDDRGRPRMPHELEPEDLVRDGLAVLALGCELARRLTRHRWVSVVEVLRAGGTVADVAAAMDLDLDEVRAGVRSWADGQELLQRREGRWGLTAAEADAVRSLVEEVAPCSP